MLKCVLIWVLHVIIIYHLKLPTANARSMVNKLVYIELLLKSFTNDFDNLAFSETLENDLNCNLINIPGYTKCNTWDLLVTQAEEVSK